MSEKYVPPKFDLEAFNCPICNAYAHQKWYRGAAYDVDNIKLRSYYNVKNIHISNCMKCKKYSIWESCKLIFPRTSLAPMPTEDMPKNVKEDYNEARNLVSDSPRAAAALLRLALQKLTPHLGEKGKKIDVDIANLVEKGLPVKIQKALDILRVIGNASVHPGQIDMKDNIEVAILLFGLLNTIVSVMITNPKEIDKLYKIIPETKRKRIEDRDKKSKS